MNKLLLTLCLCVTFGTVAAQDIITTHKAEEIAAKVIKIGPSEIEYFKWERLDGPIYAIARHEVFFIKFADGTKEIITPSESLRGTQHTQTSRGESGWYGQHNAATTGSSEIVGVKPWGMRHPRAPRTIGHGIYPRYQGEVSLGYGVGVGMFSDVASTDRIVFETVHGVRINPYVFAGLGLGYTYFYDLILQGYDDDSTEAEFYQGEGVVPIFANAKGFYPLSEKVSLYMSLDLGVATPVTESLDGVKSQFYTAFGPGITFGRRLRGDFGIRFQHMGEGLNAILFRVGFGF